MHHDDPLVLVVPERPFLGETEELTVTHPATPIEGAESMTPNQCRATMEPARMSRGLLGESLD